MGICAAVAAVAGAGAHISRLHGELQGGELRLLAELLCHELVERRVGMVVNALLTKRPGNRAGQELGRAASMNRPALDRLAVVVLGETGDDGQLVSERLERLQDWGELEAAALSGGRPVLDHHAVRDGGAADRMHRPAGDGEHARRIGAQRRSEQKQNHQADGPSGHPHLRGGTS